MTNKTTNPRRTVWRKLVNFWWGYDYFIAYRSVDGNVYAENLYDRLSENDKFSCFLDKKHYAASYPLRWLQTTAIRKSRRLIVVVTPRAHESDHVCGEVKEFKETYPRRSVIPIGSEATLTKDSRLRAMLPDWTTHIVVKDSAVDNNTVPSPDAVTKLFDDFTEEKQSTKRERALKIFTSVLAALLIVAAGLAVSNYRALQAEKKSFTEAVRQRGLAMQAYEYLTYQVQQKLENRAGTREVRRNLLLISRDKLKEIAAGLEGSEDPTLRDTLSVRSRLLDIKAELGEYQSAFPEACALLEAQKHITAAEPANPTKLHDLVVASQRAASIAAHLGQAVQAIGFYRESEAPARALVKAEPAKLEYALSLATTLARMGDTFLDQGNIPEAKKYLAENHDLCKRIYYASPSQQDALIRVAEANYLLGKVYQAEGKLVEAGQAFADAFTDAKTHIQEHPSIDYPRWFLAQVAYALAECYLEGHDEEAASKYFSESATASRQVFQADPESTDALSNLANSLGGLGRVRAMQKHDGEALQAFHEAVNAAMALRTLTKQSAQGRFTEAFTRAQLADALVNMHDLDGAITEGRSAISIMREMASQDPFSQRVAGLTIRISNILANAQAQHGDSPGAVATIEELLRYPWAANWPVDKKTLVPLDLIRAYAFLGDMKKSSPSTSPDATPLLIKAKTLLSGNTKVRALTDEETKLLKMIDEMLIPSN